MMRLFEEQKGTIAAIAVLALLAVSSIVIVDETEQAVVLRFREPARVINRFQPGEDFGNTGAGVVFRIPFVESLTLIDKRMLTVSMDRQQVLSTDQQPLEVDAFARFRIIDPVRMVKSAGTTAQAIEQLKPILSSQLRQELGKRSFQSLLTAERGQAMRNIKEGIDREARQYGAQVIDVRIKRADLPEGTPLNSAFARMTNSKEQDSATIVAQGERDAQIIRAEAQATSSKIYADSFGQDANFYDFWRAMRSYETTFANPKNPGQSTIILSPDNDYLRQFRGKGQ